MDEPTSVKRPEMPEHQPGDRVVVWAVPSKDDGDSKEKP